MEPYISVIFTTYNSPEWLEKVFWGMAVQTLKDFEILVADDGSGEETREVVKRFQQDFPVPVKHVWHEDSGFRKCEILNKAIVESAGKYLIFTDGDCVPRKDFVETHFSNSSGKHFLSGGAVRLPMDISKALTEYDIKSGKCFDQSYLNGLVAGEKVSSLKLTKSPLVAHVMNSITTAKATWNGGNASCFKEHILAVNGMDERMLYGGEDRQLGERLVNLGLTGKQLRYKAITVHLEHSRGYKTEEGIRFNEELRRKTKQERTTWSPYGIIKQAEPPKELLKASQERFKQE